MTRNEAVRFLVTQPYKFAHLIGFTKLGPMHNEWMKKMLTGTGDMTLQGHRGSYKTTCLSVVLSLKVSVVAPVSCVLLCVGVLPSTV